MSMANEKPPPFQRIQVPQNANGDQFVKSAKFVSLMTKISILYGSHELKCYLNGQNHS